MRKLRYEPEAEYMDNFLPIKLTVPDWYKTTKLSYTEILSFDNKGFTFKACVPFLDSMVLGYAITLSGDVICENRNGNTYFTWGDNSVRLIDTRDLRSLGNMPVPSDFRQEGFMWNTNVHVEIPEKYSVIVTHPLNRYDLPFLTLSGVVDSGLLSKGSLPFFIKKDFYGLIPAGTPIAQIIPFRLEDWKAEKTEGVKKQGNINGQKSQAIWKGWYKATRWKKKSYN